MSNEPFFAVPTPLSERNGTTSMFRLSSTRRCQRSPQLTSLPVRVSGSHLWRSLPLEPSFGVFVFFRNLTCARCSEIAADSLKGRVFEISLADLNRDAHEQAWRKVRVQVEEVKGFDCYTNFYGIDITRDKLCTLVKKWHTTIESFVQAKTSDGYLLRMFCIAFTRRHKR